VPPQGRTTVLQELHSGHPGITRMKSLARGIVWFILSKSTSKPSTYSLRVANTPMHTDYAGPFLGQMWLVIIETHSM